MGHITPVDKQETVNVFLLCLTKRVVKKLWRRHLPRVSKFVSYLLRLDPHCQMTLAVL